MKEIALLLVALFSLARGSAEEITVAAAADLQSALREIAGRFESRTGIRVKLTFGASGTFFAQLQNGAPYDAFFSADSEYPRRLQAAGLTEPGSLLEYADGKLVLWTPVISRVDVSRGLAVLRDGEVKKVAIANPAHAPYGRAAEAALKKSGVWLQIASKIVMGENIAQTAEFVHSGNAEVGILALSLALSPAMKQGKYFVIPQELYPPIRQAAVVLRSSAHDAAARRFVEFMKSDDARSVLKNDGFELPQAAK